LEVTEDPRRSWRLCHVAGYPEPRANLASEAIGTFVLVLVAAALGSKAVSATGTAPGLARTWWLPGWASDCRSRHHRLRH